MENLQMNTSKWARWTENRFIFSRILSKEEPCKTLRMTGKGYILLSVRNHTLFCHTHFPAKIWTANCITQPQTYYMYSMTSIIIWAASRQNQQSVICAQRRLRSTWASVQSDQSLRCPHEEYKNLLWVWDVDRKIRPRVTVKHHEASPSNAKQWTQGTGFSIHTKQPW